MHMPYGVVGYDPGEKLLHRWPYHICTSFLSSRHFTPITAQIQGRTSVLNSFDPVVGSACRWCPYDASNCFKVLQDVLEEMGYPTDFYNELIMFGPFWTFFLETTSIQLMKWEDAHLTYQILWCLVMHCDCMRRCLYHGKVTIEQLCQIYDRCIVVCALSLWLWETGVIRTKGTKGKRYSREREIWRAKDLVTVKSMP